MRSLFQLLLAISGFTQLTAQRHPHHSGIQDFEMRIDSSVYTYHVSEDPLKFWFTNENPVCQVTFRSTPDDKPGLYYLAPSGDFEIIDSLNRINDLWRFKIRFRNLTETDFLSFTITNHADSSTVVVPLQPMHRTWFKLSTQDNELFIGEEKTFEIISNNPENIVFSADWTSGRDIDYRLSKKEGTLRLHVLANNLGNSTLSLQLRARKPSLYENGRLTYDLPPLSQNFNVRRSRLQFLTTDKKELTFDENTRREGIEIQIDGSRLLEMGKTYRIENQEEPGGPLIAELFTKNQLANNRVLAIIRPYNLHRSSEGYLYIKDGDRAGFITNFSITPNTSIARISILRDGKNWTDRTEVYPGETVDVRIEGQALHKARFQFEDVTVLSTDSIIRSETKADFRIKIPLEISKKSLTLYNFSQPTGWALSVREFQEPRPFDYVYLNYGDMNRRVNSLRGPLFYDRNVRDIVFSFAPDRIDEEKIHGKQYLEAEIVVTDKNDKLVEMKTINNITVCPSDKSPRAAYYDTKDCNNSDLSLNSVLRKRVYDLEEWSKIKINLQNKTEKYNETGYQKEMEIYIRKKVKIDLDVSFPAGLITIYEKTTTDENGISKKEMTYGNLGGISMALIEQISFYHPEKIGRVRPYKFGAGFIALNAFNFNENAKQDLGIVALAMLFPTTRDSKLSFPLYIGGGYLIKERTWMFLVGPGVRISL